MKVGCVAFLVFLVFTLPIRMVADDAIVGKALPPLRLSCSTQINVGTLLTLAGTGFLAGSIRSTASENAIFRGFTGTLFILAGIDLICAGYDQQASEEQPNPTSKLAKK